jgi:hypothetical protein
MLYWKDVTTIDGGARLVLIPFGKSIINTYEGRNFWNRRVSKGILCIAAIDDIVQGGRESNEEVEDRLLNAEAYGLASA